MQHSFNNWLAAWGVTAVICCGASMVQAGYDPGPEMPGNAVRVSANANDAEMLVRTLSEEQTEIRELAGQQAQFRKLGGNGNTRIARMYGRWIREHKAGAPLFVRLIQANGGDPDDVAILHEPRLGRKMDMLHITHMAHMEALRTSQLRHEATPDWNIKRAMRKRADLARKHMREMAPFHNERNCPMCRNMKQNHNM